MATQIRADSFSAIVRLSEADTIQANPVGAAIGGRVHFFWLARDDRGRRIMTRAHTGDFGEEQTLLELPAGARAGHLDAVADAEGHVWLAYTQMLAGTNTIEVLRVGGDGASARYTLCADDRHNQRPCVAAANGGGVWVAWDSLCDGSYDVYACRVHDSGPSAVERVSDSERWHTIPALTTDPAGQPWVAWIACEDVVNDDLVFDQAFTIECARRGPEGWEALPDREGSRACADLRHDLTLGSPQRALLQDHALAACEGPDRRLQILTGSRQRLLEDSTAVLVQHRHPQLPRM
jgi:hypothetical protein